MTLNDHEIEKLRLYVISKLQENTDLFDFEHEIDRSISYDENLNLIDDKIEHFKNDFDYTAKEIKSYNEKYSRLRNPKSDIWGFWRTLEPMTILVVGDRGSGKTAISFKILDTFRLRRQVYVYRHPKPELLEPLGFRNLYDLGSIERLSNAIIYIDEPQLYFPRYDKRSNETLIKLCSIARHTGNILVFSTSDTGWVNRQQESYIDVWVIKDIDFNLVKRGSLLKKVVEKIAIKADEFRLNLNEYLFYSRRYMEHSYKIHTFTLPFYFNERYSKPFATATQNEVRSEVRLNCEVRQKVKVNR